MTRNIKGTDIPGITFDAIIILCHEWHSKYRTEDWNEVYKQLATILGYCTSSVNRYKDFFKYGLISLGWLNDNKLTKEARDLFTHLTFKESRNLYKLTGKITLFDRMEQKKKRKVFSVYIKLSDLYMIHNSISRNAFIKLLRKKYDNTLLIDKQMVQTILSQLDVFSKNSTTIPRRASDVYNWICWLKKIEKIIHPETILSKTVS